MNCILAEHMRYRTSTSITKAWSKLHDTFSQAGAAPISNEFIQYLRQQQTSYQLFPPHTHRRNIAECAIQTYRNHFKGGLTSVDPDFPLSEWDRFIEQANITINLLRSSRANPKISAYTYIFSEFNFNDTPLAPPEKKMVTHIK